MFCLALQSSQESLGTIGREHSSTTKLDPYKFSFHINFHLFIFSFSAKRFHIVDAENFMTGYHLVFDRENLKLRWSRSDCESFCSLFFS